MYSKNQNIFLQGVLLLFIVVLCAVAFMCMGGTNSAVRICCVWPLLGFKSSLKGFA